MNKPISMGLSEGTIAKLTLLEASIKAENKAEAVARAIEIADVVIRAAQSGKTVLFVGPGGMPDDCTLLDLSFLLK